MICRDLLSRFIQYIKLD